MEEIIQLSTLTPIQKQTLRARYIPAVRSAKRARAIFGAVYWVCMAVSVLGGLATTIFLASGAGKAASETLTYIFATISSVSGAMMILVKSLKINEFYFNSVADDLDSLVWILITATVPDWDAFVEQFTALQKRERGKLQEIAAQMQERHLRADDGVRGNIRGGIRGSIRGSVRGSVRDSEREETRSIEDIVRVDGGTTSAGSVN